MRVYLATAMTNPARDLTVTESILRRLESLGHAVPTRHVAFAGGPAQDGSINDSELARRDLAWLAEADALVAEVSAPSHGVGVEVAAAVARPIPVLLLHRRGVRVSRLLLGLDGVQAAGYSDTEQALASVDDFLTGLQSC